MSARRTSATPRAARPAAHLSIDVPNLARGLAFYEPVFGFVEVARPFPTMAVLDGGAFSVCLHERDEGSAPAPNAVDRRRYARHWTPVHLDLHVTDFDDVLARITANGGVVEQTLRGVGPKPVAFCSDPFGHGFCVIGEDARPSAPRRRASPAKVRRRR